MLTPTSRATPEDIVQADIERVDHARWAALCEMYADLQKVRSFTAFAKWRVAVNKKAFEIFSRLQ